MIEGIAEQEDALNETQRYLLKKCLGIYHYNAQLYEKACHYFDELPPLFPKADFQEDERADAAYMHALAQLANGQKAHISKRPTIMSVR